MRHDQKPEIGTVVHLRPKSKTASAACRNYRPAKILSYERWPLVLVEVQYAEGQPHTDGDWITVHESDVGLHPSKTKPTVDMAGADRSTVKPKLMPGKKVAIELPPGWSEEPLF